MSDYKSQIIQLITELFLQGSKRMMLLYQCVIDNSIASSQVDLSIHTWVDQIPMPLFTLQVGTTMRGIRGISDVGFNPQRVPACSDLIYSSANALR